jgi:tetratricopeptide (TPR) repeat protein
MYINMRVFAFTQVDVDVSVKREGFAVRTLDAAGAASMRARFHAAMNRPVEAQAAINDARKAAASAPESFLAEALLLDRAGDRDQARAAYARAAEAGSTSAYTYYRLASLTWRADAPRDTMVEIEKLVAKAVELNTRSAPAYAFLGEVRSFLRIGDPLPLVLRAISLEPSEADYRLAAARVCMRDRKFDEATKYAQAAIALSDSAQTRRDAQTLLDAIARAR